MIRYTKTCKNIILPVYGCDFIAAFIKARQLEK